MEYLNISKWIPVKWYATPTSDGTKIEILTLPKNKQEVLICTKSGTVDVDTFNVDDEYGIYFESYNIHDVKYWMPMPKGPCADNYKFDCVEAFKVIGKYIEDVLYNE